MRTEENYSYDDSEEYINVGLIIRDYWRILKKTWLILGILIVTCIAGLYFYNGSKFQTATYNATVYYSVESVSSLETNKVLARRLANGAATFMNTPDFRQDLCKEMKLDEIKAGLWCVGKPTNGSNLFSVQISCTDPELIDPIMKAFEKVYPVWVEKSMGNSKLTVMDEAESMGINVSLWTKKKIIGFGGAAACGLWFVLATILIISVRKIHNQAEMYQVVDAECLGTIPEVKKKVRKNSKKDPLLITNNNIDTGYLQSIRTCRDILEREIRAGKQSFVVASTMPGEGKSLLTANLAYALSRRGKKVALVDADIYRAGLSELLQIPSTKEGFSDYLCSPEKTQINVCRKDGLYVVPAGKAKDAGMAKYNSLSISSCIDGLKKHVDVILIDTPPSALYGDALTFTDSVDEIIYVIRGNYASVKDIRRAIQPYYQAQKLGGYILNRVVESVHDNGRYGYGGGYGYSRYRYGSSKYHKYGYNYASKKKAVKSDDEQENKMSNDIWNL